MLILSRIHIDVTYDNDKDTYDGGGLLDLW